MVINGVYLLGSGQPYPNCLKEVVCTGLFYQTGVVSLKGSIGVGRSAQHSTTDLLENVCLKWLRQRSGLKQNSILSGLRPNLAASTETADLL
jgi:hypothetical protein